MELRRIQYFVTLAEQLHFSHAADDLYISQSSLSYHIAELELELGVRLFNRDKRQVTLTKMGLELLPIAKEILRQADLLKATAERKNAFSEQNMELNICLDDSSQRYDLLGIDSAIARMRTAFPDADIKLVFSSFGNIIAGLKNYSYDVGFVMLRYGEKLPSAYNVIPIFEDVLSIVSIFDMNFSTLPKLFESTPLFLLKDDHRWANQITALFRDMNIFPDIRWENNFAYMLSRVTTGEGLSILPRSEFQAESKNRLNLKAINFSGKKSKIFLCAAWMEGNYNQGILPLVNSARDANNSEKEPDDSFANLIISPENNSIKSNT
ncbi:MAG: LysR family transcriptional regulator [Eubacterium sp.]|nr:LysR family transcriptional regulator [Eubacterium sp.]